MRNTLRKHAYSNILKISPPKTESFQIQILIVFIFLRCSIVELQCLYAALPVLLPHSHLSILSRRAHLSTRNEAVLLVLAVAKIRIISAGYPQRIVECLTRQHHGLHVLRLTSEGSPSDWPVCQRHSPHIVWHEKGDNTIILFF